LIRILNAEPLNYSPQARRILQSLGKLDERQVARHELLFLLKDYDVLIVRLGLQVDRQVIDAAPRLKAIVTATTGLDHIDVDYAHQRGIAVLSVRGETEFLRSIPATAELTWGLLLALARRIPWAFEAVKRGEWQRDAFRGHDLVGKHLSILGLGRIGERVAGYGLAFSMQVAAYDPYRTGWLEGVGRSQTLKELVEWGDVLTLHVPLSTETVGLIGAEQLAWMSPQACLINTSRGAVVDEAALLLALQDSKLAGAALDVVSGETGKDQETTHRLIAYAGSHDNLIITPHIGGATVDSMAATEVFMAKKLSNFLNKSTDP